AAYVAVASSPKPVVVAVPVAKTEEIVKPVVTEKKQDCYTAAVIAAEVRTGLKSAQVWAARDVEAINISVAKAVDVVDQAISWPVFVHGTSTTVLIRGLDPVAEAMAFQGAVLEEVKKLEGEALAPVVNTVKEASLPPIVAPNAMPNVEVVVLPAVVPCAYSLSESNMAFEVEAGCKALAVAQGSLAMFSGITTGSAAVSTQSIKVAAEFKQQHKKEKKAHHHHPMPSIASLVAQVETLNVASAAEYEVQAEWSRCIVSISNQIEALHQ
ncbi:UNVERIFIED_CONTAM: hypothetical protein HDU68_005476, partial [Siphonaria sp. JEL0065]